MIELRELVAAPGLAPLTAVVRVGEVVRLDGDPAAARAVLEVIAGRRAAVAGEVIWRDPGGRGVIVRAGEELPPGVDGRAALALWGALARGGGGDRRDRGDRAGEPAGTGKARRAAAWRGFGTRPVLWLVDGSPGAPAEAAVAAADEQVRGGDGALVWTAAAGRGPTDRTIVVEAAGGEPAAQPAPRATSRSMPIALRRRGTRAEDRLRDGVAIARFAGAAAGSRGAVASAAVTALWLALIAAVIAAHEGFWYVEGSREGLAWIERLTALAAGATTALAAATRAAVGRAWPAMLRETAASSVIRRVALAAGDGAGAAPAAMVAAWPAIWAAAALDRGGAGAVRALVTAAVVVAGAAVAGAVTRATRATAAFGALVGLGVVIWFMW